MIYYTWLLAGLTITTCVWLSLHKTNQKYQSEPKAIKEFIILLYYFIAWAKTLETLNNILGQQNSMTNILLLVFY